MLVEENLKSEIQFQESWTINNIQFQDLLNIMLQQKKNVINNPLLEKLTANLEKINFSFAFAAEAACQTISKK